MIACDTDMLELRFEGDDALAAYLNNAGHDEFGRPQPANNMHRVQNVVPPLHVPPLHVLPDDDHLLALHALPDDDGSACNLLAQFNASIPHNPLQPIIRPKKAEVPCQRPVELHRFRWGDDNPFQPRVCRKKTEAPCHADTQASD